MELYPAVQDELRAVLRAAFPGPAPPSAAEIVQADVPYLDAACEETFRLSCTATCSLRQALVDTHVLGCPVPKGAELLLIYCVDRAPPPVDEALRSDTSRASAEKLGDGLQGAPGRDLGTFQPRRWLVRDEQTGKEVFNAYAVPSLTFGGGYRGCFGKFLRDPSRCWNAGSCCPCVRLSLTVTVPVDRTQACRYGAQDHGRAPDSELRVPAAARGSQGDVGPREGVPGA
jgi:hypothetical protein